MTFMERSAGLGFALMTVVVFGCGGGASFPPVVVDMPRQTTVWIGDQGADEVAVADLRRVGVDELVVRRGTVHVTGGVPVLRAEPSPPVANGLPVGVALELRCDGRELSADHATALWRSIGRDLAATGKPNELLIALPHVVNGLEAFFQGLSAVSHLDVVPVVSVPQLSDERVVALVEQTRSCVVIALGELGAWRSRLAVGADPLREELAPLARDGVVVRLGVVIRPRTDPPIDGWGLDFNPLTEGGVSRIDAETPLDRSFTLLQDVAWSGREWRAGQRIDVGWVDVSRLHAYLGEASRITMPMYGGTDLLWLPPAEGGELGMTREALVRYLDGYGPEPELTADVESSGSRVRVSLTNRGPFPTAVTGYGNWVEVTSEVGGLVAPDRGEFDRVLLGRRSEEGFERVSPENVNSVRLIERYVPPGETIESGWLRRTTRRGAVFVRWQATLTMGDTVSGTAQR